MSKAYQKSARTQYPEFLGSRSFHEGRLTTHLSENQASTALGESECCSTGCEQAVNRASKSRNGSSAVKLLERRVGPRAQCAGAERLETSHPATLYGIVARLAFLEIFCAPDAGNGSKEFPLFPRAFCAGRGSGGQRTAALLRDWNGKCFLASTLRITLEGEPV